jgi:regulator of protease activity HflC (stomatin/prohibitin superfamily)
VVAVSVQVPARPGQELTSQQIAGEARVVQLFGRYRGTIRAPGLHWVNPFARRRPASVRIRNLETAVAKVNDADGNPIEIAAVVWRVEDTAKALYAVNEFAKFVAIQTETAVRHVASSYPCTTAAASCHCATTRRRSRSSCRPRSRIESGRPA